MLANKITTVWRNLIQVEISPDVQTTRAYRSTEKGKRDRTYRAMFYLSVEIMIVAIILAAIIEPQAIISTLIIIPYIAAGIVLLILFSFAILSIHSSKPLSRDDKKEQSIVR